MYDYDMLVIGSGPSGRRAAVQFAKLGKSVLVVEKGRRVGGVSVHTGTIPSKTLRETVLNLSGWRERGFYGRSYRVKQDIAANDLIVRLQKTSITRSRCSNISSAVTWCAPPPAKRALSDRTRSKSPRRTARPALYPPAIS